MTTSRPMETAGPLRRTAVTWITLALLASSGACKGRPDQPDDPVADRCGAAAPAFDPAVDDPFAEARAVVPPDDRVPPFAACQMAYEAHWGDRARCEDVDGRRTLLVSQQGEADPRWRGGGFDALFGTIGAAIDGARHCDTVVVRPGVYREQLRVEGKDVRLLSDTWNEDGTVEDGDERVAGYVAERLDLGRYYQTGERVVTETRQPYLWPLRRALRVVLEGGGFAEGPTLGGTLPRDEADPDDPNRGCGNRRPMVDFVAGTTRNTVLDGFTVRLMPEQDHTIPGHGHTLQCRGGSPIIRNNVIHHNGSTGVGVHASWRETTPLTPPCAHDPSLAQATFKNEDYRHANVEYRPVPLVYGNISYQNNGLGLGNNHYSCAVMHGNEVFWNAVPGEEASHQSPGIGTRHGAKTLVEHNLVYQNAWTGIAVRQGYLQPEDACAADPAGCHHIDERTQAVVRGNIVFDNGFGETPLENQGGIALDGVGLPDEPVIVEGNVVFGSRVAGIGVRNDYAGAARGFVLDDTYALIAGNRSFANAEPGISCKGAAWGTSHCTVAGNDSYWNAGAGVAFVGGAVGSALHNVAACNYAAGFVTLDGGGVALLNNIAYFNVTAGIVDPGAAHDFNVLSGNGGWEAACGDGRRGDHCRDAQYGAERGGAGPGANDLFVDPLFTAPLAWDFGLQPGSPAADSGTDVTSLYAGWAVTGSGPDRGSHER